MSAAVDKAAADGVAPPVTRPSPGVRTAAVFKGAGRMDLVSLPIADPGPGEVRVRIEGCGVCASNLPLWEGRPWFAYPGQPGAGGHEAWGRVEATGAGVDGLRAGDRVAFLSERAYADADMVAAGLTVVLPPELEGMDFPGEALGCAMNVARRALVRPGSTVAIVGMGFLGALLTRICANRGARVIALSRRAEGLDLAMAWGAWDAVSTCDPSRAIARVADLTGSAMCDRAIEVTGKQEPLDLASALCRVRGRLVIAGYHQDGKRSVDLQDWNWRGLDVVNAHERDASVVLGGVRAAVAEVVTGRIDPRPLFTHVYPLARIADAFATASARPPGFVKALVKPGASS